MEVGVVVILTAPVTVTQPRIQVFTLGTTFAFGYKFISLTDCESLCKCKKLPDHLKLQFQVCYTADHLSPNQFHTFDS